MSKSPTLPELPPRHEWEPYYNKSNTEIVINAVDTIFNPTPQNHESVYWVFLEDRTNRWELHTWYVIGGWTLYETYENVQDAVNVAAALCWLGVSEYKFKDLQQPCKKLNETTA